MFRVHHDTTRHDTGYTERETVLYFLFFLALVVFFSSTSARNQKKKLEKRQVSRLPTNTKLKKSTQSPNAHLCKQKKSKLQTSISTQGIGELLCNTTASSPKATRQNDGQMSPPATT
jgi:hypothetical protein